MSAHIAVDLGATSGRIVLGEVDLGGITITEVHRFRHHPRQTDGLTVWDFDFLWNQVIVGLRAAEREAHKRNLRVDSIGVDTWAVDYGLIDSQHNLLGPVHSYRSARTDGVMERVIEQIGRNHLYEETGIQLLPFNTIFQLVASRDSDVYNQASQFLLLPDLINNRLCASTSIDVTNASTTQLLDPNTRDWHEGLISELDLRRDLFPSIHEPGTVLGVMREELGVLPGVIVVGVASHDTASAFAGTPLGQTKQSLVLSCGTWALLGIESRTPVTGNAALEGNVTNELGAEGTVRILKNTTGLWLLEECRRSWEAEGITVPVDGFSSQARELEPGSLIDSNDNQFSRPIDMPLQIQESCRLSGQRVPQTPAEICRVILDSLAFDWAKTITLLERVTESEISQINMVGGGSKNELLAELTATSTGLPVVTGPAEATIVGNLLLQAIAQGTIPSLATGRQLTYCSSPTTSAAAEPT